MNDKDQLARMPPGVIVALPDSRIPIIAQMAAVIFTEMLVFKPDDRHARRAAVDQAFLLYGEIAIRLAENDR